jgi:hypothetical protein
VVVARSSNLQQLSYQQGCHLPHRSAARDQSKQKTKQLIHKASFHILTAMSMNVAVFWVIAQCSLAMIHPDDGSSKHV